MDSYVSVSVLIDRYEFDELQASFQAEKTTIPDYLQECYKNAYTSRISPERRLQIQKNIDRRNRADSLMRGDIVHFSVFRIKRDGKATCYMSHDNLSHYQIALDLAIQRGAAKPPADNYTPFEDAVEISEEHFQKAYNGGLYPAVKAVCDIDLDTGAFAKTYGTDDSVWHLGTLDNAIAVAVETSELGPGIVKAMHFMSAFWKSGTEEIPKEVVA